MPTYIILGNWTEQGIKNIKEGPNRLRQAEELFGRHGAQLVSWHLTFGAHDFVAVMEAPDDTTIARLMLTLGSLGNVRTTTLKTLSRAEYEQLAGSLG
jgi:uncharacterized protein with GYD domain